MLVADPRQLNSSTAQRPNSFCSGSFRLLGQLRDNSTASVAALSDYSDSSFVREALGFPHLAASLLLVTKLASVRCGPDLSGVDSSQHRIDPSPFPPRTLPHSVELFEFLRRGVRFSFPLVSGLTVSHAEVTEASTSLLLLCHEGTSQCISRLSG